MGNSSRKNSATCKVVNKRNFGSAENFVSKQHVDLSILNFDSFTDVTLSEYFTTNSAIDMATQPKMIHKKTDSIYTNYNGDTLLHFAVMNESSEIFCNSTRQHDDSVDLNTHNSTLHASDKLRYIQTWIEYGLDVDISNNSGCIPLHYAARHRNCSSICEILITNGSNINKQNDLGETPLHIASKYGGEEIIYMLLFHGADPRISDKEGYIPLMTDRFDFFQEDLKNTLYYFTFDNKNFIMELKVAVKAMIRKWSLFPQLLENVSEFIYDTHDLKDFNEALADVKVEHFKLFVQKFDYILKDMFSSFCTFTIFLTTIESLKNISADIIDFLNVLFESNLAFDFIQSICTSISPVSSLVKIFSKNNFPVTDLEKFVCFILSYGADVTYDDLNVILTFYGYCELFKIMLHVHIITADKYYNCCPIYNYEVPQKSILSYFICDVRLNIERFLEYPVPYLLMDLDILLYYFAHPQLRDFLMDCHPTSKVIKTIQKLPSVPLLVELARNVAKKHIIKIFNIEQSSQFYTILKRLPINNTYKKILSFETILYYD